MPSPEAEDNPFSVEPIVIEPLIEESATCQSTLNDKPCSRYPSYSDIGWSADTKPSYGEVPTPAELPNTITLALRASPHPSMASPPPDSLSCYAQSVPAYCPSSHPGFPPQMYQYIYQTACYQSVSVQKQPSYPAFPIQGQTGSSGQHHQMVQYGGSQQHQMVQFGGPQQHQMVQYGQTTCRVPQVPTKGHSSHRRQPGAMGSGLTGYSSLVPIMGPMTYSTPSPQTMDTYPNTNCYSTVFTSQHFGSPVNNFPAIASQLFNSSTQCQRHGVNSNKAQPQPLEFAPVVGLPPLNPRPAERIGTQNRPIVIAPDSRILQESDGLNRNPQDDDVAMMRQSYGVDTPTRPPQCKDSKGTGMSPPKCKDSKGTGMSPPKCKDSKGTGMSPPKCKDSKGTGMSGRKGEINISGKCFFKMEPRVGLIEEVQMIMASDEHDPENTLSAIQQRTKAYLRLEKHLPRVVQIAVSELKAQALVSEKKKKMFFDSLTNVHLLTVSSKCDHLPKRFRGIIFSHLGDQLPCSKKTLNYHTWFLKVSRVEEEIKDYLERLRETVQKEMPEQVNHYQWDCETTKKWQHQQMTMLSPGGVTPPPEVPTVCDDAVCRHVLPAKKYTWSPAARTLVQEILEKKRSTYSKKSKVPHVDRLAHYVKVAIVDVWPEGWMDRETLFSEFPTVLAAKQPKKQ